MQGARRRAWLIPRPSRATPQTPLAEPTRRDRTDLPSLIVVASLLGIDPTASAPPRLKANPFGRGHAEYSDRLLAIDRGSDGCKVTAWATGAKLCGPSSNGIVSWQLHLCQQRPPSKLLRRND